MGHAFLIVTDSPGIGGTPDAGANMLAHIAAAQPRAMPHLDTGWGLGAAVRLASGRCAPGLECRSPRHRPGRLRRYRCPGRRASGPAACERNPLP